MKWIREATINEVLETACFDGPTVDTIRAFAPYTLWCFDVPDLGTICAQPHDALTPQPIQQMFNAWLIGYHGDNENAVADRRLHFTLVEELRVRGHFLTRPVIRGSEKWILDGRHRLLAAFDVARGLPSFQMELFWGRAATHVLNV